MQIDGNCHCEKITFRAVIEESKVRVCHCTDCQSLTGTAFRVAVPAPRKDFQLLSGQPKIYTKVTDDGKRTQLAFCGDCGSPIYSAHENSDEFGIRIGCIKQRQSLIPSRQIWCRSALPWVEKLADFPKFEKDFSPAPQAGN